MLEHKGTKEIITDRLVLRRFLKNDIHDMYNNWASDSKVTRFMPWSVHKDIEETCEIVETWIDAYENMENYNWCIVLKEFGKAVGSISVVSISNQHEHCEVGYCIGSELWGQGIVAEALKAIIDYLVREVEFERIYAVHNIENIASGKVMKKASMKYEGRLRNYHKNKFGEFYDCDIYSILRNEVLSD